MHLRTTPYLHCPLPYQLIRKAQNGNQSCSWGIGARLAELHTSYNYYTTEHHHYYNSRFGRTDPDRQKSPNNCSNRVCLIFATRVNVICITTTTFLYNNNIIIIILYSGIALTVTLYSLQDQIMLRLRSNLLTSHNIIVCRISCLHYYCNDYFTILYFLCVDHLPV